MLGPLGEPPAQEERTSLLPRGPRRWPEHPLEAPGAWSPQVGLGPGHLMRSARRGGAVWGRRVPGEGPSGAQRDPRASLGWPVETQSPRTLRLPSGTAARWRPGFKGREWGGAGDPPRPPSTRPGSGRAPRGAGVAAGVAAAAAAARTRALSACGEKGRPPPPSRGSFRPAAATTPARSCPRGRSEPGAPRGARDLGRGRSLSSRPAWVRAARWWSPMFATRLQNLPVWKKPQLRIPRKAAVWSGPLGCHLCHPHRNQG